MVGGNRLYCSLGDTSRNLAGESMTDHCKKTNVWRCPTQKSFWEEFDLNIRHKLPTMKTRVNVLPKHTAPTPPFSNCWVSKSLNCQPKIPSYASE